MLLPERPKSYVNPVTVEAEIHWEDTVGEPYRNMKVKDLIEILQKLDGESEVEMDLEWRNISVTTIYAYSDGTVEIG